MSEAEKLRALLAEARRRLRWYVRHDGTDEASDGESKTYFKGKQRAIKTLARIDAELSEPYNIPFDDRCTDEGCSNFGEGANIWTPEYDYCDERNITHLYPCPLAKDRQP